MFLKSLTLKGFKSFASATTLDMEPGVTVVVGPNGSGKSNVVDAIAWVLGAQSPKSVRSQKMDDVIFAGTTSKAALGRAEVSLTIDNSARLLPIEFEEVTITRILFRTGESEYALNGVPCRLLDIQELLSDTGVGRQQHVIISQGQIDAVLNARPEERRAIIEEAAGVLKFRRRKEKSERRLEVTEGNLTRVQDLLREVRRQLKPLERQADAARRHGDLVNELTALRAFVAGQDIASLKDKQRLNSEEQRELDTRANELSARIAGLDEQIGAAESKLAAAGASDISDIVIRAESVRERVRSLQRVLDERVRALDRERESSVDGAVRSTIDAELHQVRRQTEELQAKLVELATDRASVDQAEAELAEETEAFEQRWAGGVESVSDETAQVRGELTARRHAHDQALAERQRATAKLETVRTRAAAVTVTADGLRQELADAQTQEEEIVAALDVVTGRLTEAATAVEEMVERHAELTEEHRSWKARSEALGMALAELRAGTEDLIDVDGMLGTLVEVVEVDAGFEAAFATAVGDLAAAMVARDVAAAANGLELLRAGDTNGAILALGLAQSTTTVPTQIAHLGVALRNHVRGTHPGVDPLLDRLIGGAVVAPSWDVAVEAATQAPDALVVTDDGGAFESTGWKVGGSRNAVTGAALAEATAETERLAAELGEVGERLRERRQAHTDVDKERAELQSRLDTVDDAMMVATDKLSAALRDQRDLQVEIESLETRIAEVDTRLDPDTTRIDELAERLAALEADEAAQLERASTMERERRDLEQRRSTVAGMRADLNVRASSLEEQRVFLDKRREDGERRLERHLEAESVVEQWTIDDRHGLTVILRDQVMDETAQVDKWLEAVRAERARQTAEVQKLATGLDGLRKGRDEATRSLESVRAKRQKAEVQQAELNMRLESVIEALRRDLDMEPAVAVNAPCPELPEGMTAKARLNELEKELRVMGPVNPLALEEYEALKERFDFLTEQLEDVKESRRELRKVIRAIDDEIVSVFSHAYVDVAENFVQLFSTLFPGGQGKLRLTDPSDMLNTGIEVEARPSGKNVRKLSLLSGGERSLTALAYLFAVFRSRPSPFYVMDEVEAALDDVNLHRFLELVAEFRDDAQLIIVSHQKRTMEAADCLYGITMAPGGSSRAVSEKPGADMSRYVEPQPAESPA